MALWALWAPRWVTGPVPKLRTLTRTLRLSSLLLVLLLEHPHADLWLWG